ncbi:DUF676-domain-containing protein [Lentinula aciculospora]|uniref:DUF676-domain-containing protein n=1 Tax=Lentinula aciculospora TaxID=153920 RepID=A0A9W9DHL4_9AGAR|nr:DUF676-domain-containing protein [Lentinula aciculospora]
MSSTSSTSPAGTSPLANSLTNAAATPVSVLPVLSNADTDNQTPVLVPVHLLVLVHGMWGQPGHLSEMARVAKETYEDKKEGKDEELRILLAEANREEGTYDGIDWCGERVVDEIVAEINVIQKTRKRVTKFSITGYSLGGLVSRYVVGILAQRGYFVVENTIGGQRNSNILMIPMNFNTIATPHIGLVRYSTLFSALAHRLGPKLLSRTGEQFYLKDEWVSATSDGDGESNIIAGRPLLDILSDPSPNLPFYNSLTLFKQIRIFANAVNDLTVPYVTAAMEEVDPFVDWVERGVQVEYDPRYKPLITSYTLDKSKSKPKPRPSAPLIPLPPFLIKPFPINLFIYSLLPLLAPLLFVLVFIRFTRATRRSRLRIRALEDTSKSKHVEDGFTHVMQAIGNFERRVERGIADAVVDTIDDPVGRSVSAAVGTSGTSTPLYGEDSGSDSPSLSVSTTTSPGPSTPKSSKSPSPSEHELTPLNLMANPNPKPSKNTPLLTPLQHTICKRLNTLPGLKKEIAFIDEFIGEKQDESTDFAIDVSTQSIESKHPASTTKHNKTNSNKPVPIPIPIRNSHAPIVSRDVRNFVHHRIGGGVLRAWAEGLVM